MVPPSLERLLMLREVAKEFVTSKGAGSVAVRPVVRKYMGRLDTVSPRLALLPTLTTPPLTWVANMEFTPLRTKVPKPVLNSVHVPLILVLTDSLRVRPAPTSKPKPL